MTVLLTGGLGAIGSWALRSLVERGERPVVVDTRTDTRLVSDLAGSFDLEVGDALDPAVLYRVGFEYGVDRVCHLAAVMPPAAQADPAMGFRVNASGTVVLLQLARALHVKRFVYTSSKAVYGVPQPPYAYPTYEPIPEEHPYRPFDVYGVTKLAGELMARQYSALYGFDLVVLRLAITYGPGKLDRHGDVGIVSRMVEYARAGLPVSFPRGGDERSDFVYNRDVGRAVALGALSDRSGVGVYNVATGAGPSFAEVAATVRSLVPGAQIEIGGGVGFRDGGLATGAVMSPRRAEDELGFTASPIEEGIRDYLRWLDAHPDISVPPAARPAA